MTLDFMPGPSDFSFIGDWVRNLLRQFCSENFDQNGIITEFGFRIVFFCVAGGRSLVGPTKSAFRPAFGSCGFVFRLWGEERKLVTGTAIGVQDGRNCALVALPDKPLPYGQLLTDDLIQAMVTRIAENLYPEKVVVFGSYATGIPTADSDLDLLIVMNSDEPAHKRSVPIRRLFNPQPCPMDILVYTPREVEYWNGTVNHIITEALENGRVYYERKAA